MQDDANTSSILVKKLKILFPDHSQHISKKNLNKIVTGMATRSILKKVSYIHKESVGGVLKSLRKIRGSEIKTKQDFGTQNLQNRISMTLLPSTQLYP